MDNLKYEHDKLQKKSNKQTSQVEKERDQVHTIMYRYGAKSFNLSVGGLHQFIHNRFALLKIYMYDLKLCFKASVNPDQFTLFY